MSAPPVPSSPHEPEHSGLLAWFARNHVAANLLMVALFVGGAATALRTKVEVFPEIDPRTITVSVVYPGATPAEVEESICRRIEEAITGVEGIERVRSVAAEGAGNVTAEMEDDADDREVLDDVKSAVEQIVNFPPEDAEDPRIADTSAVQRVLSIALSGDAPERSLRELAFRVRDDLTALDGISLVSVEGVRDYEIGIEVSERRLRELGASFEEVSRAVKEFSVNLPGGSIRTEGGEILLRANGQAYDRADFESIVLRTSPDGTTLRLGDVADVVDGFEDVELRSLYNGRPAVHVHVSRVGDQRVLAIEEAVDRYLATLALPDGVTAEVWANSADILRSRIDLLVRNGLMGLCLVFACLVLFLDLRLALWTTLGVPLSFLGAFLWITLFGGSINMVSLFAFILVLGIVVDDAIVIGENVFEKREQGVPPLRAAIEGLREVVAPVTVGVLTTMIAFLPLYFTEGFFGQILWVVPIVVVSVLGMSLMEAMWILPAHLSTGKLERKPGALVSLQTFLRHVLEGFVERIYLPLLRRALRLRYATVAAAIAAVLLTGGLVLGGHVRFVLFPDIDSDNATISLQMASGTPVSATQAALDRILAATERVRDEFDQKLPPGSGSVFRHVSATLGSTPQVGPTPPGARARSGNGSNLAQVSLELLEGEKRPFLARDIVARLREEVGEIAGASKLSYESRLLSAGKDVEVHLAHADFDRLLLASTQLEQRLSEYSGVVDISNSFEPGKRELDLSLTEAGLASGLTLEDLARQVRQAYYGAEAQRVQRGRDDIKVLVRYAESERRSLASIYEMRVRLPSGDEVPFRTVAHVEEGRGYATIERTDRRRVVSVSARVEEDVANAGEINADLKDRVLPALARDVPGLSFSFEGAERERMDSLQSLLRALAVAIVGIFCLIAVQLRSYVQPLIIMAVIPLGIVGAVLGHLLLGFQLSFFSLFGVVALAGVVVNDSLVLMDMINRLRDEGMDAFAAAIAAGRRRFRPILFTTLTTCFGLFPMILEKSLQAQFLIPMAVSLASGVAFATLITLFLVPALDLIREDLVRGGRRVARWIHSEPAAPLPESPV